MGKDLGVILLISFCCMATLLTTFTARAFLHTHTHSHTDRNRQHTLRTMNPCLQRKGTIHTYLNGFTQSNSPGGHQCQPESGSSLVRLASKRPEGGTGFGFGSPSGSAGTPAGPSKNKKQQQQQQSLPPKFQMAYTCNRCETRNLITIDREAYTNGIVIAVCKGCQSKHLVADNEKKLDFANGSDGHSTEHSYRNIEEILASQGRSDEIQRVNLNDINNNSDESANTKSNLLEDMDLEYNEKDGVVTLKPHILEQNKRIKDAVWKQLKEEEGKDQEEDSDSEQ